MKYFLYLIYFFSFQIAISQTLEKPNLPDSVVIQSPNSPFRKIPENTGEIIYRIKSKIKAPLLDIENDHLKIRIDSIEGYVSYVFAEITGTPLKDYFERYNYLLQARENARKDSLANERLRKEELRKKEEFDFRLKEMVDRYGKTNGEKIAQRIIWIGMSEQMLIDSWGYPLDINRTVTANMVKKQFVYPNYQYVYLENGKVTAWQD